MINTKISDRICLVNSYLIILFVFCLPISTSGTSILGALILLLWIIEGGLKAKIKIIFDNKISIIVLAYIFMHLIGLLWTEDFDRGYSIIAKQWKLLLLPVLLTIVKKDHIKYYLYAFIIAMMMTVSISYLVWFEMLHFKNVSPADPTIFMDRISYNIFLCVAIYMTIQFYLLKKHYLFLFIIVFMTLNMFMTQGRAGHVAFFVMIPMVLFQYFNKNIKKSLIAFVLVPLIFIGAYKMSPSFKERMNLTWNSMRQVHDNSNSSIGQRLNFLLNSLEIIKKNPVIGVGTGDFTIEYSRINELKSPQVVTTDNPHNQYVLVLAQFGLVGFIIFLSLFYYQLKYAMKYKDDWQYMRFFVPVLFLVIMLGETYLMGHRTCLLFSLLSAVYYNNSFIEPNQLKN